MENKTIFTYIARNPAMRDTLTQLGNMKISVVEAHEDKGHTKKGTHPALRKKTRETQR